MTSAASQSRLDRLVTLLDTGSTPGVRATAARQLGQIASIRVRGGKDAAAPKFTPTGRSDSVPNVRKSVKVEASAPAIVSVSTAGDDTSPRAERGSDSAPTNFEGGTSLSSHRGAAGVEDASAYRGVAGNWDEALLLLSRVLPHLRSRSWDTRVAAASAVERICSACGIWDPDVGPSARDTPLVKSESPLRESKGIDTGVELVPRLSDVLSLSSFSLASLLRTGSKLLSSAGSEFDAAPLKGTVEERLAQAKKHMASIGLGGLAGEDITDLGVDVDKDLLGDTQPAKSVMSPLDESGSGSPGHSIPKQDPSPSQPNPPRLSVDEEIDLTSLSARERNQLKRKRKLEGKGGALRQHAPMGSKTRIVESGGSMASSVDSKAAQGDGSALRIKSPLASSARRQDHLGTERPSLAAPETPTGPAHKSSEEALLLSPYGGGWPFGELAALLLAEMFSARWEIRHGAALGLRSLFVTQGSGAGKYVELASARNAQLHAQWCEDAAVRLLTVLALDRLGDFVFDQVVAPVRETTAQSLASLLKHIEFDGLTKVVNVLVCMVQQEHLLDPGEQSVVDGRSLATGRSRAGYAWEVRHAGLLGLKWLVQVRGDISKSATPGTFDAASRHRLTIFADIVDTARLCLRDEDDDVRAVAAQTLLPVADGIATLLPAHTIDQILDHLWDCLDDIRDDLSSSTGAVMDLLASIVAKPNVSVRFTGAKSSDAKRYDWDGLIPRLLPFFRHTIPTVRLSVLNALSIFLQIDGLSKGWLDSALIRLLFQNLIVEEKPAIRSQSNLAWYAALRVLASTEPSRLAGILSTHLGSFHGILMTPLGSAFDAALFLKANPMQSRNVHDIDKGMLAQDLTLVGTDTALRARLDAAVAIGGALAHLSLLGLEQSFGNVVLESLSSPSALQCCLSAIILQSWAETCERDVLQRSALKSSAVVRLHALLEAPPPATYAEMTLLLGRLQAESRALYDAVASEVKVPKSKVPQLALAVDPLSEKPGTFTIETAKHVAGPGFDALLRHSTAKAKVKAGALPSLVERQRRLVASIGFYETTKTRQDVQVQASVASAVIAIGALPPKLNPVIRGIMNSIKFEEHYDLQSRSARALANLAVLCTKPDASSNPNDKIVKNLCAFVCQDATRTAIWETVKNIREGILCRDEAGVAAQATGGISEAPRRSTGMALSGVETEEIRQSILIRRGAEQALSELCARFGGQVFEKLPNLWECCTSALIDAYEGGPKEDLHDSLGQPVLDSFSLLITLAPQLDSQLHSTLSSLLPPLTNALRSPLACVRHGAADTMATLSDVVTTPTMIHIAREILPLMRDASSIFHRQGAMEAIQAIVRRLDLRLLPYVIVLIVPVLGRMSDPDARVRFVATSTFASLVKMVPLESGLEEPPGFPEELLRRREQERNFVAQLLGGSKVEEYQIPVPIRANLRKYQRDGVSWMAFLAQFQLHGVLCDDMGLGKTLQSICILASKHFERAQSHEQTRSADSASLPSLVVCPPTLTGHWVHEIAQYATNLRPLLYAGQPHERANLQRKIPEHDVVVMSYDALRGDIGALSRTAWFYCILDEGHIIKNAKTKTTKAVKEINAQHRLVLSGTPIQNNVLELWSLFDFLMPGFLGTERAFHDRYGKPILASRDGKVSAKEHEAASLALDALHKQILPFLLRRLKEDVLDDLPPKIIQDVECDLSPLQKQIYDDFSKRQNRDEIQEAFQGDTALAGRGSGRHHVFQTLQHLRKLVNHPALVYDQTNPRHRELHDQIARRGGSLKDIEHAPKLQVLRQLLLDCGIGGTLASSLGEAGNSTAAATSANAAAPATQSQEMEGVASQHRVLIFCQLKQMLDIIENDLFKAYMPGVTYLRLDGSVPAERRHGIVQTFNSDPSIDVLLLTTSIGGLGLTLTGADTVIFVEHDWNPSRDAQAMDRAHRLGQRKVVNVYRLITRDTLEARIMGLQRFKTSVANAVVTNTSVDAEGIETHEILDLFDVGGGSKSKSALAGPPASTGKRGAGMSQKTLLDTLETIQDTGDDYAGIYDWKADSD